MIYEITVHAPFSLKVTSLGKYFKNKENAQKYADELNEFMNVYFVREIKLEDEDKEEVPKFD